MGAGLKPHQTNCVVHYVGGAIINIGPNGEGNFPNGGGWLPLPDGIGVQYNNEKGVVIDGVTMKLQGCQLTPVPTVPVVTSVPVPITVVSEVGKTGMENHGTTMGSANMGSIAAHLASQTVSPGGLSSVHMVPSSPTPMPTTTPPTTMVTKHVTAITA